jgi:DNA anti-recombination protein RmuC
MTDDKSKTLWGEEFRVVQEGLAETDVVIFVEKMMRQHRESLRKLDHIEALHELATKTVEDAERLAARIIEEAEKDSKAESKRIAAEAEERAAGMLAEAEKRADDLASANASALAKTLGRGRRQVRERLAGIEAALKDLEDAATRELSTRMRSHYIGKHLYQSVHFIPAFHDFIRQVEAGLKKEEREALPEVGPDATPTSPNPAEPETPDPT